MSEFFSWWNSTDSNYCDWQDTDLYFECENNNITHIRFSGPIDENDTCIQPFSMINTTAAWPPNMITLNIERSCIGSYSNVDKINSGFGGEWHWDSIFQMQHLQNLDIEDNSFYARPLNNTEWNILLTQLQSLYEFDIAKNKFSGDFTGITLYTNSNITDFSIAKNLFNGTISEYDFLMKLPHLITLDIAYNDLHSDSIDINWITYMPDLQELIIDGNMFSGSINVTGSMPKNIRKFIVGNNLFTSINWNIFRGLTKLNTIDIDYNSFISTEIDWSIISNLSHHKLRNFDANHNNWTGYADFTQISDYLRIELDTNIICNPQIYFCPNGENMTTRSTMYCTGKADCSSTCKCTNGSTAFTLSPTYSPTTDSVSPTYLPTVNTIIPSYQPTLLPITQPTNDIFESTEKKYGVIILISVTLNTTVTDLLIQTIINTIINSSNIEENCLLSDDYSLNKTTIDVNILVCNKYAETNLFAYLSSSELESDLIESSNDEIIILNIITSDIYGYDIPNLSDITSTMINTENTKSGTEKYNSNAINKFVILVIIGVAGIIFLCIIFCIIYVCKIKRRQNKRKDFNDGTDKIGIQFVQTLSVSANDCNFIQNNSNEKDYEIETIQPGSILETESRGIQNDLSPGSVEGVCVAGFALPGTVEGDNTKKEVDNIETKGYMTKGIILHNQIQIDNNDNELNEDEFIIQGDDENDQYVTHTAGNESYN